MLKKFSKSISKTLVKSLEIFTKILRILSFRKTSKIISESFENFQDVSRNTGSFRINAHDITASYSPWENFYAPGVAALCSMFYAVFVQVVIRTREHD